MEFIERKVAEVPEASAEYSELGQLYDQKLWHQLAVKVEELLLRNVYFNGNDALELYNQFLSLVSARMNPVKLAVIVSLIGRGLSNPVDAMELYQSVLSNRNNMDTDAVLCLDMDIVLLLIQTSELDKARQKLEEYEPVINGKKTSESVAFSKYFRSLAEYKKIVGPAQEFYSAGIQFLSYTTLEDLRADERHSLARDMAMAALSGESIYHFGEVLATPILSCLTGTADEWLQQLVQTINAGDVSQFKSLTVRFQSQFASLAAFHEIIQWKSLMLALVNLIFERPSDSRIIAFGDIAARCEVALDQVEWVIMKSMALGLVKGSIDEVSQAVKVTWIQPRVLDVAQLSSVNQQLGVWIEKVKTALVTIDDNAAELFV
jgi:26S proteasome regulatory subunit N9